MHNNIIEFYNNKSVECTLWIVKGSKHIFTCYVYTMYLCKCLPLFWKALSILVEGIF